MVLYIIKNVIILIQYLQVSSSPLHFRQIHKRKQSSIVMDHLIEIALCSVHVPSPIILTRSTAIIQAPSVSLCNREEPSPVKEVFAEGVAIRSPTRRKKPSHIRRKLPGNRLAADGVTGISREDVRADFRSSLVPFPAPESTATDPVSKRVRYWKDSKGRAFYDCECGDRKPSQHLSKILRHSRLHDIHAYQCSVCQKVFDFHLALNAHMKSHKSR